MSDRTHSFHVKQFALTTIFTAIAMCVTALQAGAQTTKKPNIVVIFGDDIGTWNVGAYTHGMMGRTPNIDRIADEGMLFTDHYGQQESHEWGVAGRKFFAAKLWALNSSAPFIQAHIKTLEDYPPRQGADTLSMKKALDEVMQKMQNAHKSTN